MIHKAAIAAKKFGPKSSKKFGKNFLLSVCKGFGNNKGPNCYLKVVTVQVRSVRACVCVLGSNSGFKIISLKMTLNF